MELMVEFRYGGDEFKELRLEQVDTTLDVADINGGIVGDDTTVGSEAFGGQMAVSFTGEFGVELPNTPGEVLDFEDFGGRWAPGFEGHAFDVLADGIGIEGIGFAALQLGGGEVFDGLWVDDHDVDKLGFMKG